ncbi:MAG: ATP-binding cassette domain-containing protein [bacterium]|nr:ATP-binding cassette domain-containing protein [bacterium]
MAFALGCESVSLEYPTKVVLKDFTIGIDEGERIGVVGRNGDGKSSLIGVLAQRVEPDSGRVFSRKDISIALLRQSDSLDDSLTVAQTIFGDAPEYSWASDPRIREILDNLVSEIPMDSVIGNLSGGERRRVDLARVLVGTDEVLMLDEPTNHLDVHSISWLAAHLKRRWPKGEGVLLVVTHDRWFLDEVCTSMWEVHGGGVEPFEGGYSAYVLQRVEREEAARVAEVKRQNLLRRELAWLSRGARARATKPKFHVEAARALIADVPPLRESIELKRAAVARLGKQAVEFVRVVKSFGQKRVLDDISWVIAPGDRIGILGENGAGKTTMLGLIAGELEPDSGYIKIGKTVQMATLSQRLTELEGEEDYRVREILTRYKTRYMIDGKEVTATQLLERLGFNRAHIDMPVSKLSGGQKRRLQLMLTLLQGPNVLILDEPGNDMDIDMLAEMESVLDSWPGTLIMVTHDRYLMERVTDNQYALIDGKIRHLPRGVDEYLELMAERGQRSMFGVSRAASVEGAESTEPAGSPAKPALSNAERQSARKRLASAERRMETMRAKIERAQADFEQTDPTDYVALTEAQDEIARLEAQMEELELEWLEVSELLGE